jgi:hypothetical protein
VKKAALLVAIIATFALVALLMPEGGDEPTDIAETSTTTPQPAQQLEGVVLEGVDDKGGRWKVRAESAQADELGSVGKLSGIAFSLRGDTGELKATAKNCAIDAETSIGLSGSVEIEWDQWVALMEEAFYDIKAQSVTAETGVKVTGEVLRVSGRTLEIDIQENVATVGGKVKAVFEGVKK